MRLLFLSALALLLASPLAAQDPAPAAAGGHKSILWSKTWEGALREAKVRNVPIYILVSIGEG